MNQSFRLDFNEILSKRLENFVDDTDKVTYLFHSGLQELVTLLSAIYISGVYHEKKVPPGLISRLVKAFNSPTLGGIFDGFLLWITSNDINPSLKKLSVFLTEIERKGKGWFGPMIQLRNKFEHPQEFSRQQILENGIALLSSVPDLSSFGHLICRNDDSAFWESDEGSIPLDPFLSISLDGFECFREIKDDGTIVFSKEYPSKQGNFHDIWQQMRILDTQLAKPDLKDIKGKILLLKDQNTQGESPWWSVDLINNPVICRFAEPGSINNSEFVKQADKMLYLKGPLREGELPDALINRILGLDPTFKTIDLNSLLKNEFLILNINTEGLSSKSILSLMLWLADHYESAPKKQIRIVIERKYDELESDQQKLWERIPENIEKLLCKPPGSKGSDLKDFFWSRTTKKKLFNIF